MQALVYETDVRTAVEEPGKKPETPRRIYKLTLVAQSEGDFEKLREIFESLREEAKARGILVEDDAEALAAKARAAQNN